MTERLHFLSFSFFLTVWTFISKVMFLLFNMLSVFSCVSFQIFLCKYTYINICMYVSFFFLSFFFFFLHKRERITILKEKTNPNFTLYFEVLSKSIFVDLAHHI